MRLALKAQGQCRATLETLAVLKNPPTVFAKQANIAAGAQQVTNTPRWRVLRVSRPGFARTREFTKTAQPKYWRRMSTNGWTPARRRQQARAIRRWRPWDRTTGPRTVAGKARSAHNRDRGGRRQRELMRALDAAIRAQREALTVFNNA
jgi:hypothetical protein